MLYVAMACRELDQYQRQIVAPSLPSKAAFYYDRYPVLSFNCSEKPNHIPIVGKVVVALWFCPRTAVPLLIFISCGPSTRHYSRALPACL